MKSNYLRAVNCYFVWVSTYFRMFCLLRWIFCSYQSHLPNDRGERIKWLFVDHMKWQEKGKTKTVWVYLRLYLPDHGVCYISAVLKEDQFGRLILEDVYWSEANRNVLKGQLKVHGDKPERGLQFLRKLLSAYIKV